MTMTRPPIAALSFLKRSQKSCRGDLPSTAGSAIGAADDGSGTAVMRRALAMTENCSAAAARKRVVPSI